MAGKTLVHHIYTVLRFQDNMANFASMIHPVRVRKSALKGTCIVLYDSEKIVREIANDQ